MQKVYLCIPCSNIWNQEAMLQQMREHYPTKDAAITAAKEIGKRYEGGCYILEMQEIVEYKQIITTLKSEYELSLENS